jgi:heptosyltransferase-1
LTLTDINSSKPRSSPRILIVRVGAMGDVLHGMPAVAALRAALPNATIDWAVEPRWSPLLCATGASACTAQMPLVNGVHLVPAKEWSKRPFSIETLRSVRSLRHVLCREHYDIAIDLQGTIRSAVIAKLSGAPRIFGNASPRETPARWFYTEPVALTTKHVVEHAAELVSRAFGSHLSPVAAPLPVDEEAEQWCDAVMPEDGRPTVFLAPTAGWGAKQWPAERFGGVAMALAERGCRVLVNASPFGGDHVADAVVAASQGTAAAIACTLPQLIALLRRVDLVIAGDSGPLHLAAALEKPVIALFGPTDPARNGPWATVSRVLRNATSVTDHKRHSQVESGLSRIRVDEVVAAADELLNSASTPSRG